MPTFDTPDPITATVELPLGELHVIASQRADTSVEVHSNPEDQAQADAVRVELAGRDLRIQGPAPGLLRKLGPKTPGESVVVELELPADSSLSVRAGYGTVRAEGRLGPCDVHTRFGDVHIDEADSVRATAGYGHIRVDGIVTRDADLTADHGGVRLDTVGGAARVRSKYGAIQADEIRGTAELTGTYEAIDVDDAQSDVRVRTTHGNVRLGRIARGEVTHTSTHGRLEVGVARSSAAWLDLDTGGSVTNALTPREDPTGFVDTVSVYARSQRGNIAIRRV